MVSEDREPEVREEAAAPAGGGGSAEQAPGAPEHASDPGAAARGAAGDAGPDAAERPEPPAAEAQLQELAARLAEAERALGAAERRSVELLDASQRIKADFDNYRRRMLSEQGRWQDDAVAAFGSSLLPVVDNLERAAAAAGDGEAVRQGVTLTLRQLRETMSRGGIEPMAALGEMFDPTRHEAVAQLPSAEHADGEVTAELQRGYLFKGRVLRPAMVQVAKAASGAGPAPAGPRGDRAAAAGDGSGRGDPESDPGGAA